MLNARLWSRYIAPPGTVLVVSYTSFEGSVVGNFVVCFYIWSKNGLIKLSLACAQTLGPLGWRGKRKVSFFFSPVDSTSACRLAFL